MTRPKFGFRNPATIMVQGTTSDAGKSTLVTALGRILAQKNYSVVPFKPQNMALNSAVTENGGEIGRAQAVQAQACGLSPHTDMNPVLLKPNTDVGAQVIIHGKAISNMDAQVYHDYKTTAMNAVLASWQRLQQNYQTVVVEGAGSPAEINLREGDIANMGFAEAVDCPVIIIADIDKGGVFAHLVGTLELLSPSEQQRVVGFVINRFRGDIELLKPGLDWLEQRTGKPVIGVLPYLKNFYLEAEDAIATEQLTGSEELIKVVVPVLPRISNHTDFDALRIHPQVDLQFVPIEQSPPPADLIILPGSKNTRGDLNSLLTNHWPQYLNKHLRYGGKLMGICGGYQMLGTAIKDPLGIEGQAGETKGLGYLPVTTELAQKKQLRQCHGVIKWQDNFEEISGYEIHLGESEVDPMAISNQFEITFDDQRRDGAMSTDQQVMGTYLHGLFDHASVCDLLLQWVTGKAVNQSVAVKEFQEQQIQNLAEAVEDHMDLALIYQLIEAQSS